MDPNNNHNKPPLTEKQLRILTMLCADRNRKEIAIDTGVTRQTIDDQVRSIRRRLKAQTDVGAAMKAVKSGLVE